VEAVPFVIAIGHHCQLLAQGKHLERERSPAPQEVGQGGEQRNKYRLHTRNATWAPTEKSTKPMSMEFLVGTTLSRHPITFSFLNFQAATICHFPGITASIILNHCKAINRSCLLQAAQ